MVCGPGLMRFWDVESNAGGGYARGFDACKASIPNRIGNDRPAARRGSLLACSRARSARRTFSPLSQLRVTAAGLAVALRLEVTFGQPDDDEMLN